MKKLYTPAMIGALQLKNGMVMAPMVDGYNEGGMPTVHNLEYFRVRTAEGIGLVTVGNVHVDSTHRHVMPEFNLYEDCFTEKPCPLVQIIHDGGVKTFAQLIHQGRYVKSRDYIDGVQAVAPSAVFTRMTGEAPRESSVDGTLDLEQASARVAGRAVEAGLDGTRICTNSGYLFGQSLPLLTNLRTDQHGDFLENRALFLIETIGAVCGQVEKDIPVTVRMGGNDFIPGSNTNKEVRRIAAMLEQAGADGISVTGGWHESGMPRATTDLPHGVFSYLGRNIRRSVSIPATIGNCMNARIAEELVERGGVDFVVFDWPLSADPELPRKASEGRVEDIRPCVGCNQGYLNHSMSGKSIECPYNAECGRESLFRDENGLLSIEKKTDHPRKILVIGAGVAGIESSRVASLRGHRVVIWEEGPYCGGQLRLTTVLPARHDLDYLADYLQSACIKAGVRFCFNIRADAQPVFRAVKEQGFDHVVIATGACPARPGVPPEEGAHIVQAWDVPKKHADIGSDVVVVGSGAVGIETAILLGEEGTLTPGALRFLTLYKAEPRETLYGMLNSDSKKATVVEMFDKAGRDTGKTTRRITMDRLRRLGIKVCTGTRLTEIKRDRVVVEGPDGVEEIPVDTATLAIGPKADRGLYEEMGKEFHGASLVGDTCMSGEAMDTLRETYDLGIPMNRIW